MRLRIDWKRRWPLALAVVMIVAALGTLSWLRAQLVRSEAQALDSIVQRFEANRVLGRPESPSVVFEEVERNAASAEGESVRRLYVVKTMLDGSEVVVRPFHIELTSPDWREEIDWIRLPVGPENAGYLYVERNNSTLLAIDSALVALGVLLLSGLLALLLRQRGQELVINKTAQELAKRKAQVIQLERLALAGQLSANVFHDIKKPVLNIKHEVSDALEGSSGDPKVVYTLVREQTELFLQMLRELGMESFVNARDDAMEWCDLQEAIEKSLRLVHYEQGAIEVDQQMPQGGALLLKAQPHRLVQLFSNLILNAFQALGEKGRVQITASKNGNRIDILIEDDGPGVPEEKLAQIFDPFVTTKAERGGSGLGLFICKTIVDDLGGAIRVTRGTTLGGACFEISLPIGEASS